jgi:DNA repair protein RecN (Recombination protein N)
MLKNLRIKNYALVEDLDIEFYPGLNVLTGATGAGKSIIVGAVNLVLGERATTEMVRTGADEATIEGIFEIEKKDLFPKLLASLGILLDENILIIRREVSSKGASRCFVNDKQVTLTNLKLIGDRLADLHGQHQHQSLLNVSNHLEYLDNFGDLNQFQEEVGLTYFQLKSKIKELDEIQKHEKENQEKKQLYSFQANEIERANLSLGEDEKLLEERKILDNIETLHQILSGAYKELYDSENSVSQRLSFSKKEIEKASQIDSEFKDHTQALDTSLIQISDISRFLEKYLIRLEFDPQRLEEIRERLNLINSLKKKYGPKLTEILEYAEELRKTLDLFQNLGEKIDILKKEIETLTDILKERALFLSNKRKEKGEQLAKKIKKELSFLGMEKTEFEIRISYKEDENGLIKLNGKRYYVDEKGMNYVEFFVSPNPGEELKPLAKIASGGEISRIMLGLKSILAKSDQIPTMIFDEVDVGIGGEVADSVGKRLRSLSSNHQIICITHLQQIASFAQHHFRVFKETEKNRTVTKIKELNEKERVKEIARMISGEKISELTLRHAKEMIKGIKSNAD